MVTKKMVLIEGTESQKQGLDFIFTFASACKGLKNKSKLLCQ